jgi:predicted nucleotidyltransferase
MSTAQTIASQEEAIRDITRRLVAFYHPVKIYLFGSVARGESGPDSDLDFCVVVADETPPERFRAGAWHGALAGIKAASDIVPWRRTDFEQRAAWVKASLPATVVREGRILYESGSTSGD